MGYIHLQQDSMEVNFDERKERLQNATNPMCIRYRTPTNLTHADTLYTNLTHADTLYTNLTYADTLYTSIRISRWRLSAHKLYIETGRSKDPNIRQEVRKYVIIIIKFVDRNNDILFLQKIV